MSFLTFFFSVTIATGHQRKNKILLGFVFFSKKSIYISTYTRMNQLNMKKQTINCEMSPSFDFYIQSINTYTNRTTCTFTEAREFMEKNLAFT